MNSEMKSIYLDYAAATPLDEAVLAAMQPFFTEQFYNPSAIYLASQAVRRSLEEARGRVARVLGARAPEIVFTAGGTEANNLAIYGVMTDVLSRFPAARVLVSAAEHESVLAPASRHIHQEIPVTSKGVIELPALASMLDDTVAMVSVMYVNNEVGAVQPVHEIAALVAEVRKDRARRGIELPLWLHSDACQAGNLFDLHVSRLGVDLMTVNGGKVYGPKQSGALYVRAGVVLEPVIVGGGQEMGIRSGTENVAACVGLASALERAQKRRGAEVERLKKLQKQFIECLQQAFPDCIINGPLKRRSPANVHVTFPGTDNEALLMKLDECGVQAAAGSACNASSDEPSHVLKAMGFDEAYARSSLRFSLGRGSTDKDIQTVLAHLQNLQGPSLQGLAT